MNVRGIAATVILVLLCSACTTDESKSRENPPPPLDPILSKVIEDFSKWKSEAEQLTSRVKETHPSTSEKYDRAFWLYLNAKKQTDTSIEKLQGEIRTGSVSSASSEIEVSKKPVEEYFTYAKSLFIRVEDQMGFGVDDLVEGLIMGIVKGWEEIDKHSTLKEKEKREERAVLLNRLKWKEF